MGNKKSVVVGSKNPVKIQAARLAFQAVWPETEWIVEGIEVDSGVTAQPMSDEESIKGARARATRALEAKDADFGVGLEGGIQEIGGSWFVCGWSVVRDREGNEGMGATVRMVLLAEVAQKVCEGKELGEVCDIVFGGENTKQNEGYFGLLTGGVIPRTEGYRDGVISALGPLLHSNL